MLPSRPYLLRAVHQWIVDSGLTPHLLIDAEKPGLQVPESSIQDERVVLNVSPVAVRNLVMEGDEVSFVARFGGVSRAIFVPMDAVIAIYARENGRGMMFPADEEGPDDGDGPSGEKQGSGEGSEDKERPRRPHLRVVR